MRGVVRYGSGVFLTIALVAWLGAVTGGFAVLGRYDSTPGSDGAPTIAWPRDTLVPLESNRLTLVLAIHPRCPCSAATVDELQKLLALRPGRARLNVLVFKPANKPAGWASSSMSRALTSLADTKIWTDDGGCEATRFGAATSGHLLAFDSSGKMRFTGGITPQRGQVGANAGSDALASLLDGMQTEMRQTPIFGCSLLPAPTKHEGGT